MSEDFPAAHSMDTTWFAVDRDGRVGVFFSGENGQVPALAEDEGDLAEVLNDLGARCGEEPVAEDMAWDLIQDEGYLAGQGFFVFWYPDESELADPYVKDREPEHPLHIDQLPPGFRDRCNRIRFPVSFAEGTLVQPCEHVECSFYYDPAGYRATDGKTVRPFPGRKEECREALEGYREEDPASAADWHLEGEPPVNGS